MREGRYVDESYHETDSKIVGSGVCPSVFERILNGYS
jgi:hypothetical protein